MTSHLLKSSPVLPAVLFWMGMLLAAVGIVSCGPRSPVIESHSPTVIDYISEEEVEDNGSAAARPASEGDRGRVAGTRKQAQSAPLKPEYFDPYQPLVETYRLSKGDVLEISLFGQADTQVAEVVIAPDGRLYYLFAEGILADGRMISELKAELEVAAAELYVTPEISIIPKRMAGQTYVILGKVGAPGIYPVQEAVTLQQAIGNAGGVALGGFAGTTINISNLRESFMVRDGEVLDVDFERLINTDGFDQNIYVRPGDYIYVASSLHEQDVFLIGEVPQEKPIPYKDGMTVSAIMAGVSGTTEGWSTEAHVTQILVVRGSLDSPVTYKVDLLDILNGRARDVYLLPGDIVFVQKKPFALGRQIVRAAIETFVHAFVGAAGGHYAGSHLFD